MRSPVFVGFILGPGSFGSNPVSSDSFGFVCLIPMRHGGSSGSLALLWFIRVHPRVSRVNISRKARTSPVALPNEANEPE